MWSAPGFQLCPDESGPASPDRCQVVSGHVRLHQRYCRSLVCGDHAAVAGPLLLPVAWSNLSGSAQEALRNSDDGSSMNVVTSKALAGRSAVVTGSSSGIGRAIAMEFAVAGADVLVHAGRNRAGAEAVADEIRSVGQEAEVAVCDLTGEPARVALVEQAWNWRRIDIWVNNAGADVLTGEMAALSFADKLAALWRVDVAATIDLARRAGARMSEAQRGVILNLGWDQAACGMEGDSGEMFAAVKAAVAAFSRSLAKTLAPHVRVNTVAPGWIRTAWATAASGEWQERAVRESLRQRWGTPEDVAKVCRFLASQEADFVNGQTIDVNGGFRSG